MLCQCPECKTMFIYKPMFTVFPEDRKEEIIRVCCDHFNVAPIEVFAKGRTYDVAAARHVIQYLLLTLCKYKLKQIGEMFNKDHTAVIAAKRRVLNAIHVKGDVYRDVITILERLNALNELKIF